jgi:D-amino-acid dehydrogenase
VERVRVVVVGAGIAGASTAYALARAGCQVIVLDDARPGRATAAGAGIVQPWSSPTTGPFYELYAAAAAHYPELIAELSEIGLTDTGYRRCGALVVNEEQSVIDEVEERVRGRAAAAPAAGQISRISSRQVREIFPPLAEDLHGLHISGGARVDGRRLGATLLSAVARLDGTCMRGLASLSLHHERVAVSVDGEALAADAVVVTSGAWCNEVLGQLGLELAVAPQRGQISHLRLEGAPTTDWPSVSPMSDHYMVAFDDSRIVVGATRETGSGFDARVTAAGQRHVLDNALRLAPGLRDATLIETRVGLRPSTTDTLPIIGALDGVGDAAGPQLFVATGFGAVGLTIAPLVGRQVAELITTSTSTVDLAPFAPVTTR